MTAKRIDVIDLACEEYSQEVLGFFDVISSGSPTPYYDLIVTITSPTLTPFRNNDFLLEEVDTFLAIEDNPTSPKELKIYEAKSDKSSIDEPPVVELKDLPPHLEYAFLKLTEAPTLIAPDWDMPFELMCNASDFAIGPVLGQHQDKHFRPIHYASKTMTEAESNYTTTEKEMLAVMCELCVLENKLNDALLAFRTAYKTPIRCTPYKLVYRKDYHLPVELEHKAYSALKHGNFDLKKGGDHMKV
nr:reverse transcriptase domain-containing protein [Tanacetum cinerariifolium]